MTSIILSTICALTLNAAPVSAQADTLHVFIIDYQPVPDFDGSQLVGKTISFYKVSRDKMGDTPVVFHSIMTEGGPTQPGVAIFSKDENANAPSGDVTVVSMGDEIKVRSASPSGSIDDIVYVLDGKVITADDFKKLDPRGIESITVLKDAPAEPVLQTLRDQGKYQGSVNPAGGVIVVTTKKGSK